MGQKVELDREGLPCHFFSDLELPLKLYIHFFFNFTKTHWGSGSPELLGHSPGAPPALWGPFESAPAGGARARLKDAEGSGWPQWRSAAAVRGQERSPRGAASLAQDPGRPATGTRRRCLCAPLTPVRALPATRARYPRIPGSRWPLRPGRPRARCPGRRCCSWRRCSPWPPLPGPQVRTCRTLWSVDCLFLCPPACHSGDTAPL